MRKVSIFPMLCVALLILAGPTAALDGTAPGTDYALGAYTPDDQVEYLNLAPESPMTILEESPDGGCTTGTFEEQVLCLVNVQRRSRGLYPFQANVILSTVAEVHSAYMRDHDCFSHQCSGELSPAQRACAAGYGPYGWGECFIGEAIAAGYLNPAEVVGAWMNSDGHRALLLHEQLREIGMGYVSGGYYGHYWTLDFGSQPNVLPVFINDGDPAVADLQVMLTLTNEDVSGSGGIDHADEVMISNDPSFPGAAWEPYSLHRSWQLTDGNGSKMVYIRYRDSWGDQVLSTDGIFLDVPRQYDLEVSYQSVIFVYEIGVGFSTAPTRQVAVNNAASTSVMSWSVQSLGGEGWLQVSPGDGSTPASVLISVAGFEASVPGTYQATLTLTAAEDPDNPEQLTVSVVAVNQIYRTMLPAVTRNR